MEDTLYCIALHRFSGSMPADIRKKLPGMITTIMCKGAWSKVYQYSSVMLKINVSIFSSSLLGAM